MAEINSQIYNTIEGELVTSRSDDGSRAGQTPGAEFLDELAVFRNSNV